MKSCNKCNIVIATSHSHCPLCHQTLTGTVEENHVDLYPSDHSHSHQVSPKTQRFILFFAILAIIVLGIINILDPEPGFWSLIPIGAVVYLWLLVKFVVFVRTSNTMRITVITLFLSILLYLINTQTDPVLLWSLDYVLPSLIIANNTTIFLILAIRKEGLKYNSGRLLLLVTVSLIPLLLSYINVVTDPIMALISFGHGLLILLYMLVFHMNTLKELIKRIFHI